MMAGGTVAAAEVVGMPSVTFLGKASESEVSPLQVQPWPPRLRATEEEVGTVAVPHPRLILESADAFALESHKPH